MVPREAPAVPGAPVQHGSRRGPEPQGAVPMSVPTPPVSTPAVKAAVKDFSFSYGDAQVLKHLDMTFADKQVTALIGPSGYPLYWRDSLVSGRHQYRRPAGGSPRNAPAHQYGVPKTQPLSQVDL